MNSVNASQRLGAFTLAISITFSIVWAMSAYAYSEPTAAGPSPLVDRSPQARACS